MAAVTARALVYADAHGLASHGVSRVPQYALHLTNGRADGAAMPRVDACEGRRRAGRCAMRPRVPGVRARGGRGHRPVARIRRRVRRCDQQPSFRSGRVSPRGRGRRVARRARDGQLPGGHGDGRRAAASFRHQSDRGGVSAPNRSAAPHRPVAVGSRARQADGRREGRQGDPARLGAGCGGPSHDRSQGRAHRLHGADGGQRRARCWRSSWSSS